MENEKNTKNIDEIKKDMYGFTEDDYKASYELMVTITLHEYRELVSKSATFSDMRHKLYVAEDKVEKLTEELKEYKEKEDA